MTNPATPVQTELTRRLRDRLRDTKRRFRHAYVTGLRAPAGLELHPEPKPQKLDLILAHLALAEADDPLARLQEWWAFLQPDGLLIATTWGAGTLEDVEKAPRFPDIRDVGNALVQLQFALPVVDRDVLTLTFDTIGKAQETLQALAIPLGRQALLPQREDGTYVAQLELLTLTAWRPSTNQPQPLKPGQYKVKLEEAIATNESG
jgi:SAM-dependent methyltransferase